MHASPISGRPLKPVRHTQSLKRVAPSKLVTEFGGHGLHGSGEGNFLYVPRIHSKRNEIQLIVNNNNRPDYQVRL